MGNGNNQSGKRCSLCNILNMALTLGLLGGSAYLIWFFLGEPSAKDVQDAFGTIDFSDFSDVLGNLSNLDFGDLYDKDPFLSDNSTSQWPTDGTGGLTLDIVNALDDTWQDELALAVQEWDEGDPDVLTLNVIPAEIDYSCTEHVSGLMRVCNGNFGDTGWLGINEIIKTTSDNVIQSSVAKMNEYYLLNAEQDERQYTMCHEVGHGFGLPHTDESFTNPDLGNCMDYTSNPSANMHPSAMNYNRLASMYGTVGSRRDNRRLGRGDRAVGRKTMLTQEEQMAYKEAVVELEQTQPALVKEMLDILQWRNLREHARGGDFVRRLSDDHVLEVHVLYTQT